MARYAVLGGKVDQEGGLKFLLHLFRQGYAYGWNVSQRGAGANMSVDVAVGGGLIATSANVPYYGWNDAIENVAVTTADPTNPRIDTIVAYINLSAISSASTNNPNALVFAVVAGTPAASPVAPSGGTIQTAIGAGNPYVTLANISVAAAAATIVNANITDTRSPMAYTGGYLWGGASNTKGHSIPNIADDVVALLNAAQTMANKTLTSPIISAPTVRGWDGWEDANESWAFATATTITVPTDATTKYRIGDKIKFTQGGVIKYFYIVGVTSTVLTVSPGQDSTFAAATVTNTAITLPAYSHMASPLGFPEWIPYTSSPTGFSVAPSPLVSRFAIMGRTCVVAVSMGNGTSNATTLTLTAPVTSATVTNQTWYGTGVGVDNSAVVTTPSRVSLPSASSTLTISKDQAGGAWTASGGKSVNFVFSYEI